jgi:hypothetical protein
MKPRRASRLSRGPWTASFGPPPRISGIEDFETNGKGLWDSGRTAANTSTPAGPTDPRRRVICHRPWKRGYPEILARGQEGFPRARDREQDLPATLDLGDERKDLPGGGPP